jgi:hypothetical protein
MSSERSISPDPLPRSQTHPSATLVDDKDNNVRVVRQSSSTAAKRRRDSSNRSATPPSPRSPVSRSRSRSSVEGSKSPVVRKDTNQRSPSPPRQSSSTSKRRRHKDGGDSGRHICEICNCDVETAKRLYGVLDNCDHVFCYECIVSWKRSKYSNAESESCPVCKVRSAFITPSKHWFENKEDKHHIVKKHKNHLKTLPCRYYLRHGFCRYSDRCFYDHHEAAKQYRQQNQHSRDRDRDHERDRDRHHGSHNGSRSRHHSPSPPPPPPSSSSSRHSSSRYRERAY